LAKPDTLKKPEATSNFLVVGKDSLIKFAMV